jgi:hypothetical protein
VQYFRLDIEGAKLGRSIYGEEKEGEEEEVEKEDHEEENVNRAIVVAPISTATPALRSMTCRNKQTFLELSELKQEAVSHLTFVP